jgi:hypothetical protein
MTEPTARELVDLNVLPSPDGQLDARTKSAVAAMGLWYITRCGRCWQGFAGIALLSSIRW